MKQKILAFLKSVFSEPDGTGSASRVLSGVVIVATLGWITYLVLTTHILPDLSGASLFVGAGFSGYGVNKLAAAMKKED